MNFPYFAHTLCRWVGVGTYLRSLRGCLQRRDPSGFAARLALVRAYSTMTIRHLALRLLIWLQHTAHAVVAKMVAFRPVGLQVGLYSPLPPPLCNLPHHFILSHSFTRASCHLDVLFGLRQSHYSSNSFSVSFSREKKTNALFYIRFWHFSYLHSGYVTIQFNITCMTIYLGLNVYKCCRMLHASSPLTFFANSTTIHGFNISNIMWKLKKKRKSISIRDFRNTAHITGWKTTWITRTDEIAPPYAVTIVLSCNDVYVPRFSLNDNQYILLKLIMDVLFVVFGFVDISPPGMNVGWNNANGISIV